MAWRCEHVATLRLASELTSLRRRNAAFGPAVDAYYGLDPNGQEALQGLRFRSQHMDEASARAWLTSNGIVPLDFMAAASNPAGDIRVRIVTPGVWMAKTGEVTITPEDCSGIVDGFFFGNASGVEADLKYTHVEGTAAICIGSVYDVWLNEFTGWVEGSAWLIDTPYTARVKSAELINGSIEFEAGSLFYGRAFGMVMTAFSVLPPGTPPAIPGAGIERVVASRAEGGTIMLQGYVRKLEAPDGGSGTGSTGAASSAGAASAGAAEAGSLEASLAAIATTQAEILSLLKGKGQGPNWDINQSPAPPIKINAPVPPADGEPQKAAADDKAKCEAQLQALITGKVLIGGQVEKARGVLSRLDGPSQMAVLSAVEILGAPQTAQPQHLSAGVQPNGGTAGSLSLKPSEKLDVAVNKLMLEKGLNYEAATRHVLSTDLELRKAVSEETDEA